jgi:hypothetical protein
MRYDRATVVSNYRRLIEAVDRRLELLLAKPPPDSLREAAQDARRSADSYVREFRMMVQEMDKVLSTRPTFMEVEAVGERHERELDRAGSRLDSALTELADRDC